MHVSSIPRIKPRVDLVRQGFQPVRTRVSTPVENRNAIRLLETDRQLQAELNPEGSYRYSSRPPPSRC
jgi:hypothetical protein